MNAILNALNPNSILVDERTLRDRLYFIARFAELLYFFDEHNKKNGNWSPFFLKDPVILLAYISKTNHKENWAAYLQVIRKWEKLETEFQEETQSESAVKLKLLAQLFFMLYDLFKTINRWVLGMGMCDKTYPLKNFVYKQVMEAQSANLWSALSLWKQWLLHLKKAQVEDPTIQIPDYTLFEKLHEPWQLKGSGKEFENPPLDEPEQQVKGSGKEFEDPPPDKLEQEVNGAFKSLMLIHCKTFDFYVRVINNAAFAFEEMVNENENPFPDTVLAIAFVKLMQVEQEQLNKLTQRHLDFYYKGILEQKAAGATPDEAFVLISLNPNVEVFPIPAGYQFSAGMDEEQRPIIFESVSDAMVNRTSIDQTYTLSRKFLRHVKSPCEIKRNEQGEILTWNTFGDSRNEPSIAKEMSRVKRGFAFASPMLLLESGKRVITITFTLSGASEPPYSSDLFKDCDFYLSTKKDWLKLKRKENPHSGDKESDATVQIKDGNKIKIILTPLAPPIVPFQENPDKLTVSLPMFKVLFPEGFDSSQQIRLKEIRIKARVTGMTCFLLSNDDDPLPAGAPFFPFGPIPSIGSRFSLNSPELYKPISSMAMKFSWSQLPDDFSRYYREYNDYLKITEKPRNESESLTEFDIKAGEEPYFQNDSFKVDFLPQTKIGNPVSLFRSYYELIKSKLDSLCTEGVPENILTCLNAFVDKIYKTQDDFWEAMKKSTELHVEEYKKKIIQILQKYKTQDDFWEAVKKSTELHVEECKKKIIQIFQENCQSSAFVFLPKALPPQSGAITMTLKEPAHAFGYDLYPKVVSWVSLKNALSISSPENNQTKNNALEKIKSLLTMPNLPYAPKIRDVTVDYTAALTQNFPATPGVDDSTPFEYYHYSPFGTYPVFSTTTDLDYGVLAQGEIEDKDQHIDLFPFFLFKGALYFSLKNLPSLPATLSLFFEIVENDNPSLDSSKKQTVSFWVLAKDGWKTLKVLEDGTANLLQSGILLLSIPEGISLNNPMMPGEGCWISIACKSNEEFHLQTIYANTQAIKVKRMDCSNVAPGITPVIEAGKIVSPAVPTPEIKGVLQPFPSREGRPAETTEAFYLRVSQRLKTKDRALSKKDFISMAMEADPQLAYAKCLPEKEKKTVRLKVVQGYSDQTLPTAFRPVVPYHQQLQIQEFFRTRVSAFVKLETGNMKHQEVQVMCELALERPENGGMVIKKLNEGLRLFLSPWIDCDQAQIPMDQGIRRTELLSFFSGYQEVAYVKSIMVFSEKPLIYPFRTGEDWEVVMPENEETLFVSAESHELHIVNSKQKCHKWKMLLKMYRKLKIEGQKTI